MSEPNTNQSNKVSYRTSEQKVERMLYVDNIRIFLIILVVLHHLANVYAGAGPSWVPQQKATESISPLFLSYFIAVNAGFFMSFFFLISGYFVPRSFDGKGPKGFVKDRLIRLGIPLLVYTTLIWHIVDSVLLHFARGENPSFFLEMAYRLTHPAYALGPLWFVQDLLVYTLVYVFCRFAADHLLPGFSFKPFSNEFPTKKVVFLSIAATAIVTFIVRIKFPIGVWRYRFEVGEQANYIFCFWMGILAYRGKWLEGLTESQGRFWSKVALVTILVLAIVFGTAVALGLDLARFRGGLTIPSAILSIWYSFACLSIIISLVYLFRKRFDRQGPLLKRMSPNAYTVFIIHQFIVVCLICLILPIALPSIVKFFIAALIGIPLCFLVSHFIIRNIPYAKKVLG
jgi:glucan biosynthesis protein C